MRPHPPAFLILAVLVLAGPAAAGAPAAGAPAAGAPAAGAPLPWTGPDGASLPFADEAELLDFLRQAPVVARREIPSGVTRPEKLTLEADGVRLHAIFRTLDRRYQGTARALSRDAVRDSYRSELAAYELDRLLGLGRVPPTVLRTIDRREGAVQLWIEGAATRAEHVRAILAGEIPADAGMAWVRQRLAMRLFDLLIHNPDRHHANMLVTGALVTGGLVTDDRDDDRDDGDDGTRLWFIDHTRAFQPVPRLLPERDRLVLVDRALYDRLRALDEATLRRRLAPYLDPMALHALVKRRERLLELVAERVARWGEGSVLLGPAEPPQDATLAAETTAGGHRFAER